MRGSVKGSFWGLLVGGVGLGVASVVSEQPPGNEPPEMPLIAAPQTAQAVPAIEELAETPQPSQSEFVADAPRVETPDVDVAAPAPDTDPSPLPQTSEVETVLDIPDDVSSPEIAAGLEEPVLAPSSVTAPTVPSTEESVVISTQPSQPTPGPAVSDESDLAGVAEDVLVQQDAPIDDTLETVDEVEERVAEVPDAVEEPVSVLDEPKAEAEPETALVPQVVEEPEPVREDVAAESDNAVPRVFDLTQNDSNFPANQNGVRVNRPTDAPQEDTVVENVEPADALPDDAPALLRHAAEFENVEDLPLMSVVLLDDANAADAVTQVASLPFPVTIVLDPIAPGAAGRMAAFRAAGIEVGLQSSLPDGATPADVEVAFEAAFATLDETVVVFSDGTGALQNDRSVVGQVMQVLAEKGQGFVAIQQGLGNASRAAEQFGVPAATIARDLDGDGQDATDIGRALEQAAFRARQTGGAVVLGRVSQDTLSALTDWDADQITRAPLTAILKEQLPE